MLILVSAALPTDVGPYAVVMGVGFLVGAYGHLARSRTLILAGILIVGLVSTLFAFVVGKII